MVMAEFMVLLTAITFKNSIVMAGLNLRLENYNYKNIAPKYS